MLMQSQLDGNKNVMFGIWCLTSQWDFHWLVLGLQDRLHFTLVWLAETEL